MINLLRRQRIDWFRILTDLEKAGVSCRELSRRLDIPHGTIHGWKSGNCRPKVDEGIIVMEFWAVHFGKRLSEVPKYDPHQPHPPIDRPR